MLRLQSDVIIPAHQSPDRLITKLLPELNKFPECHHFWLWNRYLFGIFLSFGHISSPFSRLIHRNRFRSLGLFMLLRN
jgi:hypothetical protein